MQAYPAELRLRSKAIARGPVHAERSKAGQHIHRDPPANERFYTPTRASDTKHKRPADPAAPRIYRPAPAGCEDCNVEHAFPARDAPSLARFAAPHLRK